VSQGYLVTWKTGRPQVLDEEAEDLGVFLKENQPVDYCDLMMFLVT
jgi:hypothetical protein